MKKYYIHGVLHRGREREEHESDSKGNEKQPRGKCLADIRMGFVSCESFKQIMLAIQRGEFKRFQCRSAKSSFFKSSREQLRCAAQFNGL